MLRTRGPHLLSVDDVVVTVAYSRSAQGKRVGARGWLRHPEGLQPQLAARDRGQPARLLRSAAVPQQGAHGVHLGMTGRAVAAGGLDFLHDGRSLHERETAAAILLGDERREIAGVRQRRYELGR